MALSQAVTIKAYKCGAPLLNASFQHGTILQVSHYSQGEGKQLTDLKRGRGGRSSFSGVVATIFGGSGFFGRILSNRLGKIGSQVIIPYRGDPYDVKDLRLTGDLGQVLFMPFHLQDEASIRKAMQHSNVVINLIGKDTQTRNFSHEKVHVEGAARLARIAREVGVEKFVHFSALNASLSPQTYVKKEGSSFLRTKALGELEVQREFPEAIIFRPADMWGQLDRFLFYYMRPYRRFRLDEQTVTIPLWERGRKTIKQPVYGPNVAEGVINAILDPECKGQIFEAVGPHRYHLDDLVRWIYMHLRFDAKELRLTHIRFYFKMKVRWNEMIQPIYPPVSMERIEREFPTDTLSGCPTLDDLGVKLTKMEDRISWELKPFRRYGYYWDALGEFPDPPNPPLATK